MQNNGAENVTNGSVIFQFCDNIYFFVSVGLIWKLFSYTYDHNHDLFDISSLIYQTVNKRQSESLEKIVL